MKTNFDETLSKITEFLKNEAKTETVMGQPFKIGQFECVPVIRVGFGIGGGEGTMSDTGEGTGGQGIGGGIGMEPVGFLVTREDDIRFIAARQPGSLTVAMEKLPEVLEKYFEHKEGHAKAN